MRNLRIGIAGAAMAISVVGALTLRGSASTGPVVIHDVQASNLNGTVAGPEQPNTEIEPSIAVNPGDSNNVITDFQVNRVAGGGDRDNGFGASLDGGQTWTYGNLRGLTKGAPSPQTVAALCPTAPNTPQSFDRASDAVITFGKAPAGVTAHGGYIAYANSLVFDDSTCSALPSGIAMNQSYDGGLTWTPAVFLEHDALDGLNDKNWIVADNGTGVGHHTGRIYAFWDKVLYGLAYSYCDPDTAALASSDCTNGAFWEGPTPVNVQGTQGTTLPAIGVFPVVLKNGSIGFAFNDEVGTQTCTGTNPSDQQCLNTSNVDIAWSVMPGAGAVPSGSPLPLANQWIDITPYNSNGVTLQRAGSLPQAAVDPNTNEVYITWEDNRFRDSSHKNQNDAVVVYATDPGTGFPGATPSSWSGPVRVDPEGASSTVDDYNPTIAIGNDSILRVAYRYRNEPAGANLAGPGNAIYSYYQEAHTGATTTSSFTSPLFISTSMNTNDPQFGAFSRGGIFEGDYDQIAAGGPDQSYFTRDEAWPITPGATCTTNFSTPQTCQNQHTWVVLIQPANTADTPESPLALGLLAAGVGGAAAIIGVRRRRSRFTD